MTQKIVAFTGLSGVGKTTFLRNLAEHIPLQHLTGGSLIAAARKARSDERDAMRYADLDENQRLLIDGFALARDPGAQLIIIDGHVVIDTGAGFQEFPADVFRALGITKMVHLEAKPSLIKTNRSSDTSRRRPAHDQETLSQHQFSSRAHANRIAVALNVEFHIATHDDIEHLAFALREA